MLRSANAATKAFEVSGEGGTGVESGSAKVNFAGTPHASAFQIIVKHERAFAGRRWAFKARRTRLSAHGRA